VSTIAAKPAKRLRLRTSGGLKPLLCYLVCFALPLLWQYAGLFWVYPFKLVNTAPAIADTLLKLLPFTPAALETAAAKAALPAAGDPALWQAALTLRDDHWRLFAAVCFLLAWAVTLIIQLWWRMRHSNAINAAKLSRRAKSTYRLNMLLILAFNLLAAGLLWLCGVQHIPGRTLWDYLVYFPAYGLNVLAAMVCFRLAAPPAISGKHAFFKRL
jgi:hypothetical protein